jgi:hypothetical protein
VTGVAPLAGIVDGILGLEALKAGVGLELLNMGVAGLEALSAGVAGLEALSAGVAGLKALNAGVVGLEFAMCVAGRTIPPEAFVSLSISYPVVVPRAARGAEVLASDGAIDLVPLGAGIISMYFATFGQGSPNRALLA